MSASDEENPSTSAQAEATADETPINSPSPSRSRSASPSPGPSSPTARSPSPGPSSPTPGPSRRNLKNAFKAFDPERKKIDYEKLSSLCSVTPKAAGNRWANLRNKHGL
ncbi:uncharacterized protein N7483_009764 [Penicillium malachiteum]|uniref:uncharacterized protein n=1 Tax=Penicillium malachiteum TaxID=1324776 RepID=UPI002546EE4F|nr:uncharacterized protein N7483_009764 [Penicillium malachiteum]KAJ5721830.1 hypothetical protein N7483_009764 [Penicillium malachiteum]